MSFSRFRLGVMLGILLLPCLLLSALPGSVSGGSSPVAGAGLVRAASTGAVMGPAAASPEPGYRLFLASIADGVLPDRLPTMTEHSDRIALGMYQPILPDDFSAVEEYERAAGKRLSYIHWYALWGGWKSAFDRADLDRVARRGAIPIITWEPWAGTPGDPEWSLRNAILSGRSDSYIESWARGLAEYGGPVLLRFAHEMHHSPYPWAVGVNNNTAADYIAAWKHIRSIFARYSTANVQWVWNPNTMGEASTSTYLPIYRSVFPGDDLVDWLGLDIYNTGPSVDWGAPYWRSFREALREPYAAITAISSKPLLIAEMGSTEVGGDKAAWISEALSAEAFAEFPRVRAIVWFDVEKEAAWQVRSSPAAFQSFITAWRGPSFP